MQGDNEAKRKILEEIKKRKSKFVALGGAGLGLFIPIALFLFVITIFFYLYESYIVTDVSGNKTIFKDDRMVGLLSDMFEVHDYDTSSNGFNTGYSYTLETAEDNNFMQELRRQYTMFTDRYKQFNIKPKGNSSYTYKTSGDSIDLGRYVSLVNYQSYLNLDALLSNYDDEYDKMIVHDDVELRDYENERVANNRDVRNFYEKAEKRIGSAFFLFPGLREIVGNSISADIEIDKIHPKYTCLGSTCTIDNLDEILSDWSILGEMYMQGENSYNNYYNSYSTLGPLGAAQNMTNALNYGYRICEEKNTTDEEEEIWNNYNICYDYNLIYSETSDYVKSNAGYSKASTDVLQTAINSHMTFESGNSYAELPIYDYNSNGRLISNIKTQISASQVKTEEEKWFITVNVTRKYDDEAFKKYLKEAYIPAVYIECDGCNKNKSAGSILTEIEQYYELYKYFNKQAYEQNGMNDGTAIGMNGGNYETAGSKKVTYENGGYTCNGATIGISADYVGHKANDLYSSETPTVFPLMEGTVVAVYSGCNTYCPLSDARSYVNRTKSLFQLSPACYCGGGWGNYVKIESTLNGKTIYATYAHLSSVAVSVGQTITYSTPLGIMGTTGVSTGKHLHIELNYTDSSSNKFPPTKLFSTKSVLSTICGGNSESNDGDTNE